MKKILALLCAILLLLTACGKPAAPAPEKESLHILATTYPVYLFTTAVVGEEEGVEVSLLVNQQTACLHDYTLTVKDMKEVEKADVVVMNGAGLEGFLTDALSHSKASVIDSSAALKLLPSRGHSGHEGDGSEDPHIWMDPLNAAAMVRTIAGELSKLDADHAEGYQARGEEAAQALEAAQTKWSEQMAVLSHPQLITFHDGFQYFAARMGLELLRSIEEEEGSEASAAEIKVISDLVKSNQLPAVFTERNGSTATAEAIVRETGCQMAALDMLMSGDGKGLQPYIDTMQANVDTIVEALG